MDQLGIWKRDHAGLSHASTGSADHARTLRLGTRRANGSRWSQLGPSTRRRRTLALTSVVLGLGLAACSTDYNEPTAQESAFCDAVFAFDAVVTPGGPEGPTPDQMGAYADRVAGHAGALQSDPPGSIASSVRTLVAAIDKARTGDTGALDDGFGAAKATVEDWTYHNCGFQRLAMTASDHRYRGISESLEPGKTAIRFRNEGNEFHIALWYKRPTGDNRSVAQALEESFGELAAANFDPERARALGFVDREPAAAPPGQTGGSTVDLSSGRYIVFCPVGTQGNSNQPHFALGMLAEVVVS